MTTHSGSGWDFSQVDWAQAGNALGGGASFLVGEQSGGTQGTFSSVGALFAPATGGLSLGVGVALDVIGSSLMAKKSKKAAHKRAREFWANAQEEFAQIKKQQAYDRSALLAGQAGTGAKLESESANVYRKYQVTEQDIAYNRYYKEQLQKAREIRKSGDRKGLF